MTLVTLVNRKTSEEQLVTLASGLTFRGTLLAVREVQPNHNWEIFEIVDTIGG